jgi:hypothetical protein
MTNDELKDEVKEIKQDIKSILKLLQDTLIKQVNHEDRICNVEEDIKTIKKEKKEFRSKLIIPIAISLITSFLVFFGSTIYNTFIQSNNKQNTVQKP